MSNYDINSNPDLVRRMIENYKKVSEKYYAEYPDSLILPFEQELRDLGFQFEISPQIDQFLPKHKETILPIAIKYYKQAKYPKDKSFFMGLFHHKGFEEVVPMLLEDYYSDNSNIDKWAIGDRLYQIRSKKYIDDYLKIISDSSYGQDRQMVILLIGKLKVEAAIPILIDLLEDEGVRLHAIIALGDFKRNDLRQYFERFQNDKHSGLRKYARAALKKLDSKFG